MPTIHRILVPTDFSPTAHNAFQFALGLAAAYQADIHLLHVILPEMAPMDFPAPASSLMQRQTEAAEQAMQAFSEYGTMQATKVGVIKETPAITSEIEIGTPADVIRYVAGRQKADLVVMGARGQHSVVDKLLGSVSTGALSQLGIPVLIVPECAHFAGIKHAIIAVEMKEDAPAKTLELGQMLSPFSPAFHAVHFNLASAGPRIAAPDLEALFAKTTQELPIKFYVEATEEDEFSERLNAFIEANEGDLLVMYSPHRSWLERLFHHSRTKEMAWQTKVPLLRV
ncbi:MAG: universal stress protein [Lewinella sp.]|nr:universal stress protein [Lewinella sp.]